MRKLEALVLLYFSLMLNAVLLLPDGWLRLLVAVLGILGLVFEEELAERRGIKNDSN